MYVNKSDKYECHQDVEIVERSDGDELANRKMNDVRWANWEEILLLDYDHNNHYRQKREFYKLDELDLFDLQKTIVINSIWIK